MKPNSTSYARAAEAIGWAEALVITAGAGMGVDSGLPDFRGREGFWRAYPPLAKLGLAFEEVANPAWFARDAALAWGFYGHRLGLYRATVPHAGFGELLRWMRGKAGGGFVFTSNVDGQFQRAGLAENEIVECHGSIQEWQCVNDCRGETWPAPAKVGFTVDEATCRAVGELPRCPHCGALARPNILMFADAVWQPRRTAAQERRFETWLESRRPDRLAVIELGAGSAISTVRRCSESLLRRGAALVRINPREAAGPAGTIGLACGAAEGIREIATGWARQE